MTIPTLPDTAWQQAVFVAIFVVFTLALVGGVFAALLRIVSKFTKMANDFQSTVLGLGNQFDSRNSAVVNAINQLLVKFQEHDARSMEAVNDMRNSVASRDLAFERSTAEVARTAVAEAAKVAAEVVRAAQVNNQGPQQ
jgi:hypothetical protein